MLDKNIGNRGIENTKVSRRQFLERLGITTGGALVAAVSLASACKPADPSGTSTTPTTTPSTTPTTTPTTAPTFTPTTTPTNTPTTSPTTTSPTPVISYIPAEDYPLIKVPESTCTIATERLYTVEHIWVKQISPDVVVMGITPTMVLILGEPWDMTLPEVGLKLVKDTDVFTSISGWKIFADFYSPVTGEIVLVNEGLRPYLRGDKLLPIVYSAFSHGWIIAVRLSKPEEINDLLTPQGYLERLGKK